MSIDDKDKVIISLLPNRPLLWLLITAYCTTSHHGAISSPVRRFQCIAALTVAANGAHHLPPAQTWQKGLLPVLRYTRESSPARLQEREKKVNENSTREERQGIFHIVLPNKSSWPLHISISFYLPPFPTHHGQNCLHGDVLFRVAKEKNETIWRFRPSPRFHLHYSHPCSLCHCLPCWTMTLHTDETDPLALRTKEQSGRHWPVPRQDLWLATPPFWWDTIAAMGIP